MIGKQPGPPTRQPRSLGTASARLGRGSNGSALAVLRGVRWPSDPGRGSPGAQARPDSRSARRCLLGALGVTRGPVAAVSHVALGGRKEPQSPGARCPTTPPRVQSPSRGLSNPKAPHRSQAPPADPLNPSPPGPVSNPALSPFLSTPKKTPCPTKLAF